jgi:hypothetical protein
MSRPLFLKRPVAVLLVVVQVAGCTSWRVETLPPAELISQKHPDLLRVEQVDGKRVMVYRPEVQGDSLLGRQSATSKGSRAVSLTSVSSVSTSHFSAGKTLGLTLGLTAVAAAVAAIVIASSDWGWSGAGCCEF